ncbi:MAG: hypothetical protein OQK04_02340, partial [Kangiellaceae bacterium]|nr:hypothetical protein [Kangiellaceae bacterium]
MLKLGTQLLKLLAFVLCLTNISACHPPVYNYLNQSQANTLTWVGAPAAELVLVKGNPDQITYLGTDLRATVATDFWTQHHDRFSQLN